MVCPVGVVWVFGVPRGCQRLDPKKNRKAPFLHFLHPRRNHVVPYDLHKVNTISGQTGNRNPKLLIHKNACLSTQQLSYCMFYTQIPPVMFYSHCKMLVSCEIVLQTIQNKCWPKMGFKMNFYFFFCKKSKTKFKNRFRYPDLIFFFFLWSF